jgi:hypothetical protein
MEAMRATAAALLLVGCGLGDRSKHCGDYVCPETYECVATPAVCAPQADIAACFGANASDFTACTDHSGSAGACYQGVCAPCENDREGCSTNGAWSVMISNTTVKLHAVWFTGVADGYAGGEDGTLLHYDGTAWAAVADFPPAGQSTTVTGIWGEAQELFVATSGPNVYQFDGKAWATATLPGSADILNALHGASAGFVLAVGASATVLSNEGGSWNAVSTPLPATTTLNGVGLSSTSDVTVAGNFGYVAQYDGAQWTASQPLPAPYHTANLNAVWVGGGDAIVVGVPIGSAQDSTIFRNRGGTWTLLPSGMQATLRAVWGLTPSLVYAGGDDSKLLVYRGDGTMWTSMAATPTTTTSIYGIGGNSEDVFAVGDGGTIWRLSQP